jgi:HEAT repeat protein
VDPLIELLNDSSSYVSWTSAKALGKIGDIRAADPLIAAAADRKIKSRVALAALEKVDAEWRSREAVASWSSGLIGQLEDPDGDVKREAARTLAEIGDTQAQEALRNASAQRAYAVVAGAHAFYLREGSPYQEPVLCDALYLSGTAVMAKALLNSGRPKLVKAAREWVRTHGLSLISLPSEDGTVWDIN